MGETHIPVALQLYTVRDEAAKDFLGTLARVAAMGYAGVELAGMGGLSARRLREALDRLGLRCAGSHIGLERLRSELPAVLDENEALGNRYIVVPALPEAMRSREASYAAVTGELNAIGAACRERGMVLAYHNHAFEFQRFGGRYALEILYDGTDPALVKGEPDVYWMVYAGADPAAWLRNHPGRCPLVHLKDMAPGAERTFAEVGEGTIDFRPIFAAGATAGVEWYIVEQDRCARPALESAALSLRHLKEWGIA
jgi:sugar phosphate isomerase/epimerase